MDCMLTAAKFPPMTFIRRDDAGSHVPNVIIGNPIGAGKASEDYLAAKSGDIPAAMRLAKTLVGLRAG